MRTSNGFESANAQTDLQDDGAASSAAVRAGGSGPPLYSAQPTLAAGTLLPPIPQPPGPSNTGSIYGRTYYSDPAPDYSVSSGNYIYMLAQGGAGTLFPWGLASLTNAGTIYLQDVDGYYGDLRLSGGWDTIPEFDNSGTIVVRNRTTIAGNVLALQDNGNAHPGTTIENSGDIWTVSDHFSAAFLLTWTSDTLLNNSGMIGIYAPEGSAVGFEFVNGGAFVNSATGQILVEGEDATGIVFDISSSDPDEVEVINAGVIRSGRPPITCPTVFSSRLARLSTAARSLPISQSGWTVPSPIPAR